LITPRDRGSKGFQKTKTRIGRWQVLVDVDRPDYSSAALEVTPRQIGRPASYRVVAVTQTFGDGCPRMTGCEDFSPSRGKAILVRP